MVKKKTINKENKYEQIKISDLIPYARNSRKHEELDINLVAGSIKEFGFINPIIIDKDNMILAGHGRWKAAEKLKLETVPCVRIEHLTETQKKAYILSDNKLAEKSSWDNDFLKLELQELKDFDFDLNMIGFDDAELNGLIKNIDIENQDNFSINENDADDEFTPNLKKEKESEETENKYKLIVTLENELQQQYLFNELNGKGYKVKAG